MNTTTLNKRLRPLAWLLVILIIVMLLIPAELTDEQLAQIKPGMTLLEAKQLLGDPCKGWGVLRGKTGRHFWFLKGEMWNPNMIASFFAHYEWDEKDKQLCAWFSKTNLLWVVHQNDLIVHAWIFPISREEGGLQGCIRTLRRYWNRWSRMLQTPPFELEM